MGLRCGCLHGCLLRLCLGWGLVFDRPPGICGVSGLDVMSCAIIFRKIVIIKGLGSKFVFLKGLWFKCRAPAFGRGFFISVFSIAGWVKLPCNVDLVCFVWVMWFGSLTCDFVGEFED